CAELALGLLRRRRSDFLAFFLHQLFKASAGLLPGSATHRHAAFALAFALVFAGLGAAATLAAAFVFVVAQVGLGRGTGPLAGAGVVFRRAQAFAHVDAAADVRLAQDGIFGFILLGNFVILAERGSAE